MAVLSIVRCVDEQAARALHTAFTAAAGCRTAFAATAIDGQAYVVVAEWDGLGAYRRALSSYDVKALTPQLAVTRDEPSAFDVIAP